MKTFKDLVNRLSRHNTGYDVSNGSMPVKIILIVGMLTIIVLAITGAIHLMNG